MSYRDTLVPLTVSVHLTGTLPVKAFWGMPYGPLAMQHRTPAHHPCTAGLLTVALGLLQTHTCPPHIPAFAAPHQ